MKKAGLTVRSAFNITALELVYISGSTEFGVISLEYLFYLNNTWYFF